MSKKRYLELKRMIDSSIKGSSKLSMDYIREIAYEDFAYKVLSVKRYGDVIRYSYKESVNFNKK